MKKILGVFLSVVLLSCATQQYIGNDDLQNCTSTIIPNEMYNFNLEWYLSKKETSESHKLEIQNDSSKIIYKDKQNYDYNYKFSITIVSKKNNSEIFYRYDSIGRIVMKYNRHTGTDIGEEIKINYSDANSTTPVETYRINYDTIYPICWKEALQIAERKGINAKESHVDILYPDHYWEEKKPMEWTIYDEDNIMYVDAFTGKATNLRKRGSGLPTN